MSGLPISVMHFPHWPSSKNLGCFQRPGAADSANVQNLQPVACPCETMSPSEHAGDGAPDCDIPLQRCFHELQGGGCGDMEVPQACEVQVGCTADPSLLNWLVILQVIREQQDA